MRQIRYRTEAFSGTQERDAVEVMSFETFELGNTDILEYVKENFLKDEALIARCNSFIEELENNGYVEDFSIYDRLEFFRQILSELEKQTGVKVNFVLWLADLETVTDRSWYGRNMADDNDFDSYETGPVILSDLGRDGSLYGYTEMPVCLKDRLDILKDERIDIINERESSHLSAKRAGFLDERYLEVDAAICEIEGILNRQSTIQKPSLKEQITKASHEMPHINEPNHSLNKREAQLC